MPCLMMTVLGMVMVMMMIRVEVGVEGRRVWGCDLLHDDTFSSAINMNCYVLFVCFVCLFCSFVLLEIFSASEVFIAKTLFR